MAALKGWVLFRAEAHPSWGARGAQAHTLLVGSGFGFGLVVIAGEILRTSLSPAAAHAAWPFVAVGAVLGLLPAPLVFLRRWLRRVKALEVDPAGLTLESARGPVRLKFADLAEVRAGGEPAFSASSGPGRRGALATLPSFAATLDVRARDGRTWTLVASSVEDVEGVLSWLGVLGAGDKVVGAPSALAAKHDASERIARAEPLLLGAVMAAGSAFLLQVVARYMPGTLPAPTLMPWVSFAVMAAGCALYLASWRCQAQAARAWVQSRGLGAGPPARDIEEALAAPAPR
ncbi:MAG TPA: hypothetical protein VGR28_13130 [Candidatus Thermoplasmatota archaeon]|jgi:hypothetical protein|nr:hypothetical protein [Candidatus Thermoplasmatota archaeon]